MTLRQKTLLLIGVTLIGLLGVLYATLSTILLSYLYDLEVRKTQKELKRALDSLSEEVAQLSVVARQWGVWDDAYKFMENGDSLRDGYAERNFIKTNFSDSLFFDFRLNLVLLSRPSGQIVFSQGLHLRQQKAMPVPQGLIDANFELQSTDLSSRYRGILLVPEGTLIVASQPIITTDGRGPSRGSLAIARYLNTAELNRLKALNQLSITIHKVNNPRLPTDFQQARSEFELSKERLLNLASNRLLSTQEFIIRPLNNDTMSGYALLRDIHGKPAVLLRVDSPRVIYKQGLVGLRYLILSWLGVGLIFVVATLLLLEKLLFLRLDCLSKDVKYIGTTNDLSMRVVSNGADELSSLGQTINWMLSALESSLKELKAEREKAEQLLLNILTQPIANRLKKEERTIADSFNEATVLFADIVGFTNLSAHTPPVELVNLLNQIFSAFDRLAEQHGLEKIKTIGDAYMVVGGIPTPGSERAQAIAQMALDMLKAIQEFNALNHAFNMRIGINTGPVVAGVIGLKKFIYDLWGDTVNIASPMESQGIPGCIQVKDATYELLKAQYEFERRGVIQVKGKGEMMIYLLLGRKS
ncbi:adenylate/guanylate cyclase domain-containing protein [Microseira wollei]|uniref:Adenylate cyclase n=1 Tax=Microseira wollei NIES-4236 TaxID=2530354 RepID=A0AAV3XFM8_9CYAN|nr:adenylate/guanylate cyclase domain-containing protein [Microseira wollei]GET41194.1 adenylate cyclase [Microseira wollei NIES-4236]